jgi:signal peptidase I
VAERPDYLTAWLQLQRGRAAPGEVVVLPVLTGSMMPLIAPGTEIAIRPAAGRDCQPGDVVVFRQRDDLTAHRLLLALPLPGRRLFYQKGDMNPRGAWIRAERVVGVVARAQGHDGLTRALDDSGERAAARGAARRQLRADLKDRLLHHPRRIRRWLARLSTPDRRGRS